MAGYAVCVCVYLVVLCCDDIEKPSHELLWHTVSLLQSYITFYD